MLIGHTIQIVHALTEILVFAFHAFFWFSIWKSEKVFIQRNIIVKEETGSVFSPVFSFSRHIFHRSHRDVPFKGPCSVCVNIPYV